MKKLLPSLLVFLPLVFMLLGTPIGEKTASMSILYGFTAVISLFLLVAYCLIVINKDKWFLLLFSSVFVVNSGYYLLAISQTIDIALIANRISYLGSVFLPLSILMSILHICNLKYKKIIPCILLGIAFAMFLLTASGGILDIYYKDVSLSTINGVTVLNKTYGSLHCLYLYYLLLYFIAMLTVVFYGTSKNKLKTPTQAVILISAVLVNLIVWLFEQIVKIDFEMLSFSYIITEVFLLGISYIIQEHQISSFNFAKLIEAPTVPTPATTFNAETINKYKSGLLTLTEMEENIYRGYIMKKTQKAIATENGISVYTVKFHINNIYDKLGPRSRKELIEISDYIKCN